MQWYNRNKQTKKQKFDEEMKATGGLDALNPTRRGFMSPAGSVAIGAMGVAGANTLVALNNGAKADGAMRAHLPLPDQPARQVWRDKRLMALVKHFQEVG